MAAHVTRHQQNSTPSQGTSLTWWAPRLLLVAMGALLGAELGVWVSEPGELDRIARSLGVGLHGPAAVVTPAAPESVAPSTSPVQDNGWHATAEASPRLAIPSIDVSVLPRAGESVPSSSPSPAARRPQRSTRTTSRSARARPPTPQQADVPGKDAPTAPLDPATLSNALSDALGE
jgi:hypothetical protein